MTSASIRKTSSHYNVYTWVAKIWDDRKKRAHYILLRDLELLSKNPYLYNKGNKKKTQPNKTQNPKLLIKAKTRKEGLWFIFET